jgi:hypothetical protein
MHASESASPLRLLLLLLLLLQYNPAMNPWKSPAVRAYMQAYYAAALQWLQGGAAAGKWRVKGVFAWNLVSWDVQGVHPLSYAGDGASFKGEQRQLTKPPLAARL